MRNYGTSIGERMDKFFKMLVEELKILWKELKDECKKKIKKIVCKCKGN
jgi:hypothetical protein